MASNVSNFLESNWIVVIVVVGLCAALSLICCAALILNCRRRSPADKRPQAIHQALAHHSRIPVPSEDAHQSRIQVPSEDAHQHPTPLQVVPRQDNSIIAVPPWKSYTYADLAIATNNFDQMNLIGAGGQANVFRGVEAIDEGGPFHPGRYIAVKRFYCFSDNSVDLHHANLQFKREVQALSRCSHRNVVEFYGYCLHGRERLLVYELVPNWSLHDWLFAPARSSRRGSLDWGQRLTIARDAARGLDYLHNHCNINLVHLDIKPQNILLDEMLHAKIADFGVSKLIGRGQSTRLLGGSIAGGTLGYRPPELNCLVEGWENNITKKADVYSFGIVLLQLASNRMVSSPPTVGSPPPGTSAMPGQTFRDAAFHLVKTQQTHLILDASLGEEDCNRNIGVRMCEIGAMCIELNPEDRPHMGQVNELLHGISSECVQ